MYERETEKERQTAYCAVHYPADYSIIDRISNIPKYMYVYVHVCVYVHVKYEKQKMINALIELIMKCTKCC